MPGLKGLITGIGSLPHHDAQGALDLIFHYLPKAPFWPQLPKCNIREGMVAQFSENLPCLEAAADGIFFNTRDQDKKLEVFYDRIISYDVDYFKISPDFARGLHKFYEELEKQERIKDVEYIKCHITGPFTFCASVKDGSGVPLLYNQVFRQAFVKGLAMKALWQIKLFRHFGKKIILFIDEPYLASFGSAYTQLNREEVVEALKELTLGVKFPDVLVGVHCCGNTDWSILTGIKTVDIISFDAFSFLDKLILYTDNLRDFLQRGGSLCWGIVPTQEFSGKETPEELAGKIRAGWEILARKGIDEGLLASNLMLSPACGLGSLDVGRADKILRLLSQLPGKLFLFDKPA